MADLPGGGETSELERLRAEVVRLNKVVQALMNRAERSMSVQSTDFGLFQTAIVLEDQVRARTADLEAALRENEKISRALRESEAKFRSLVDQSLVGIVIIEHGKFSYANAKAAEVFGYDSDEILRVPLSDLIAKEHWPVAAENLEKRMNGTLERVHYVTRCIRKDGVPVDIQVHGATIEIGGKRTLISLFTDITEQLRAERELQALHAQLRDQAIRDPLTRLFNRRYLEETLSRELIRAGRQNEPFAVIMADIDHFKAVNDQYGHPAGDQVLRVFAEAVRRCRRGSDIHCRYGGEEFVLVCPGIAIQTARRRAEQLRRAIAAIPIAAGPATTLRITASFGISLYPQHGSTVAELIAAADAALYEAKRSGRNCVRMLPERNPPCAAE